MSVPTLVQICAAIEAALSAATGLSHSQAFDELSEALVDLPMLQVYPEDGTLDIATNNDRSTFQAGVRQTAFTILADLYARQRGAGIGEEMGALVPLIDAILDVVRAQDTKPYFALEDLQAFGPVTFRRVSFVYGDLQTSYIGARFTIPVRVF